MVNKTPNPFSRSSLLHELYESTRGPKQSWPVVTATYAVLWLWVAPFTALRVVCIGVFAALLGGISATIHLSFSVGWVQACAILDLTLGTKFLIDGEDDDDDLPPNDPATVNP